MHAWRRVDPLTMVVQMLRALASTIVPAGFVIFGAGTQGSGQPGDYTLGDYALWILPVLVLIVGFNLLGAWLGWVRLRYRVGETDVRVEQGIFSRQARSVPYERIQDVSLEQKFLPRLLGLVEVKFETGAAGKDELKLAYVSEAEGEKLRETVRALVEGESAAPAPAESAEPGAAAAPPQAHTLFAMDTKRLFVFGLFNFSLVVFAVLIGALQQFEFLLPFDLWDYLADLFRQDTIAQAGDALAGYTLAAQVATIAYAVVAVVVVGMASGVVGTFVQNWDFRLERTPKGFRRRRGLLTRTDVVMPVHRVQALVIRTGIIRRRFGWYSLSFISLAQDAGSANHEVAPFAKMHEIAPIAREAGFALPDESTQWHRASASYYFDRAILLALLPVTAALVAGMFGHVLIGVLLAMLAGVLVVGEYFRWRHVRHAIDPRQVISRTGWLAPRIVVASRVKLHSVEIVQGPLARWHGYCTLHFGLAGGRLAFPGLMLADALAMREAVLASIAEVDFAHLPR